MPCSDRLAGLLETSFIDGMETSAMPSPGLIARDRAHQLHESPAARIKQARNHGDEPVGSTSQLGQVWRQESLFHPAQNGESDDVLHGATADLSKRTDTMNGSHEHGSQVASMDEQDGLPLLPWPALSSARSVSSRSEALTPPQQNGHKRAREDSAAKGVTELHDADCKRDTKHAKHQHSTHSPHPSAFDRSDSSSSSDADPLSIPPSESGTSPLHAVSDSSLSDSPPQSTTPRQALATLAPSQPPTVSTARPRKVKPSTIRDALLLSRELSKLNNPPRARSDPSGIKSPPQPQDGASDAAHKSASGKGDSGTSGPSQSSSSFSGASPSVARASIASTTSGGRADSESSPSPPTPPSPPEQRHPLFWSFPPSTPPAHRVDKSSMCQALSYLPVGALLTVRRTCRLWWEYSYQPIVWSFSSSLCLDSVDKFRSVRWSSVSMLRELELNKCSTLTDEDVSRITVCQSLQLLDLSYCTDITDAALVYVAQIKSLQILSLEGCARLRDDALAHLPALPLLHSLSLSFCSITDLGVQYVSQCLALEFLQLCHCQALSGRSISALVPLPRFTNLNLGHSSMKDDDLVPLRQLTGITALNLESLEVTEAGLSCLESLPALTSLNLHEVHQVSDRTLEVISACRGLSSLYLSYTELVTDAGIGHLRSLAPSLRVLEMPDCEQVTDAACEHIAHLLQLTTLDLTGCYRITDAGIAQLAALQHLTLLNLGQLRAITDAAVQSISHLPCLVSLELNSCVQLTPLAAQSVAQIKTLRSLSASELLLWDDSAIEHLLQLDQLDALCISGTGITVLSLQRLLARMRWIKELNVYSCPNITEEQLAKFRQQAQGRVAVNV